MGSRRRLGSDGATSGGDGSRDWRLQRGRIDPGSHRTDDLLSRDSSWTPEPGSEPPNSSAEHRASILNVVRTDPGLNKSQIGEEARIGPSLASYHVDELMEAGQLVGRESPRGGELVCFLSEHDHLWEEDRTRILYGRRTTRRVAICLLEEVAFDTAGIAEALSKTRSTVRYHLRKLKDRDLVESRQLGRRVSYRATQQLRGWRRRLDQVTANLE